MNTATITNEAGTVEPAWQLGIRQLAVWATLTDAQRTEANRLMATMSASKALAAVKA